MLNKASEPFSFATERRAFALISAMLVLLVTKKMEHANACR